MKIIFSKIFIETLQKIDEVIHINAYKILHVSPVTDKNGNYEIIDGKKYANINKTDLVNYWEDVDNNPKNLYSIWDSNRNKLSISLRIDDNDQKYLLEEDCVSYIQILYNDNKVAFSLVGSDKDNKITIDSYGQALIHEIDFSILKNLINIDLSRLDILATIKTNLTENTNILEDSIDIGNNLYILDSIDKPFSTITKKSFEKKLYQDRCQEDSSFLLQDYLDSTTGERIYRNMIIRIYDHEEFFPILEGDVIEVDEFFFPTEEDSGSGSEGEDNNSSGSNTGEEDEGEGDNGFDLPTLYPIPVPDDDVIKPIERPSMVSYRIRSPKINSTTNKYGLSVDGGKIRIGGKVKYTDYIIKNKKIEELSSGYQNISEITSLTVTQLPLNNIQQEELNGVNLKVEGNNITYEKITVPEEGIYVVNEVRGNRLNISLPTLKINLTTGTIINTPNSCTKTIDIVQSNSYSNPWVLSYSNNTNTNAIPIINYCTYEYETLDGINFEKIPVLVANSINKTTGENGNFYLIVYASNSKIYNKIKDSEIDNLFSFSFASGYEPSNENSSAKDIWNKFFTINNRVCEYSKRKISFLISINTNNSYADKWLPIEEITTGSESGSSVIKQLLIKSTISLEIEDGIVYSTPFYLVQEPIKKNNIEIIDPESLELILTKRTGDTLYSGNLTIKNNNTSNSCYWKLINYNSDNDLFSDFSSGELSKGESRILNITSGTDFKNLKNIFFYEIPRLDPQLDFNDWRNTILMPKSPEINTVKNIEDISVDPEITIRYNHICTDENEQLVIKEVEEKLVNNEIVNNVIGHVYLLIAGITNIQVESNYPLEINPDNIYTGLEINTKLVESNSLLYRYLIEIVLLPSNESGGRITISILDKIFAELSLDNMQKDYDYSTDFIELLRIENLIEDPITGEKLLLLPGYSIGEGGVINNTVDNNYSYLKFISPFISNSLNIQGKTNPFIKLSKDNIFNGGEDYNKLDYVIEKVTEDTYTHNKVWISLTDENLAIPTGIGVNENIWEIIEYWNSKTTYKDGDIVLYGSKFYLCDLNTEDDSISGDKYRPGSSSSWDTNVTFKGVWHKDIEYSKKDVIVINDLSTLENKWFYSKVDGNKNNPPVCWKSVDLFCTYGNYSRDDIITLTESLNNESNYLTETGKYSTSGVEFLSTIKSISSLGLVSNNKKFPISPLNSIGTAIIESKSNNIDSLNIVKKGIQPQILNNYNQEILETINVTIKPEDINRSDWIWDDDFELYWKSVASMTPTSSIYGNMENISTYCFTDNDQKIIQDYFEKDSIVSVTLDDGSSIGLQLFTQVNESQKGKNLFLHKLGIETVFYSRLKDTTFANVDNKTLIKTFILEYTLPAFTTIYKDNIKISTGESVLGSIPSDILKKYPGIEDKVLDYVGRQKIKINVYLVPNDYTEESTFKPIVTEEISPLNNIKKKYKINKPSDASLGNITVYKNGDQINLNNDFPSDNRMYVHFDDFYIETVKGLSSVKFYEGVYIPIDDKDSFKLEGATVTARANIVTSISPDTYSNNYNYISEYTKEEFDIKFDESGNIIEFMGYFNDNKPIIDLEESTETDKIYKDKTAGGLTSEDETETIYLPSLRLYIEKDFDYSTKDNNEVDFYVEYPALEELGEFSESVIYLTNTNNDTNTSESVVVPPGLFSKNLYKIDVEIKEEEDTKTFSLDEIQEAVGIFLKDASGAKVFIKSSDNLVWGSKSGGSEFKFSALPIGLSSLSNFDINNFSITSNKSVDIKAKEMPDYLSESDIKISVGNEVSNDVNNISVNFPLLNYDESVVLNISYGNINFDYEIKQSVDQDKKYTIKINDRVVIEEYTDRISEDPIPYCELGFHSSGNYLDPENKTFGIFNLTTDDPLLFNGDGLNFFRFSDGLGKDNITVLNKKVTENNEISCDIIIKLPPNYNKQVKEYWFILGEYQKRSVGFSLNQGYLALEIDGDIGSSDKPIEIIDKSLSYNLKLLQYEVQYDSNNKISIDEKTAEEGIVISSSYNTTSDGNKYAILTYKASDWKIDNTDTIINGIDYNTDLYYTRKGNGPTLKHEYDGILEEETVVSVDVNFAISRYKKYLYDDNNSMDNLITEVQDLEKTPFKYTFWLKLK